MTDKAYGEEYEVRSIILLYVEAFIHTYTKLWTQHHYLSWGGTVQVMSKLCVTAAEDRSMKSDIYLFLILAHINVGGHLFIKNN